MRQGVTTCSVIALWGTGAAREGGGVRHGRRKAREAKKRQSMQSGHEARSLRQLV